MSGIILTVYSIYLQKILMETFIQTMEKIAGMNVMNSKDFVAGVELEDFVVEKNQN